MSMDTWQVAGVLGVALLFAWGITNAVDVSVPAASVRDTFDFDIPAQPLRGATQAFARRIGRDTYIGHGAFEACRNFVVGPLVGRFTAKEAWRRLTAPICAASGAVIERAGEAPVYMLDHPWVAEREIRIPRASLIDALSELSRQFDDLPIDYRAVDIDEAQRLIGPIEGTMSPEQALERIEAQLRIGLRHRREGPYALVLESSARDDPSYARRYLYGRECACPVRIQGLVSETVMVVQPTLVEREGGAVARFSRKQIESTGAATVPQFFRYLAVNGYSRPEGYIASGAQYADFRGLGRDTHLVTINGRRTLPSANNVTSSAFDLNTIPLPAVEHIDLRLDSASMRTGSDAIAGTIDIVTRRKVDGPVAVQLRYGTASGGARERRATVSMGQEGRSGSFAAVVDYFELGGLLGAERPLSRDQNYLRFGGTDFRQAFAIRSTDGTNLPGLQAPLAGIPLARTSDALSIAELMPGEAQRVSLSRYQSLVPAGTRASVVGAADYFFRGVSFAADLLWVKRDTAYDYYPAIASGLANEALPGNPFHAPVAIDALLTGAPSMQQHVDSELRRGVLSAKGPIGPWQGEVAAILSKETAEAWVDQVLDAAGTSAAFSAREESLALDVFAMRPGAEAPASIWAAPLVQRFTSSGTHMLGSLNGPIGPAHLQVGLEQRTEAMQFSAVLGRVERDVQGMFAHLKLPLIRPERKIVGVHELTALAGVRRDDFSDGEAVTRRHVELTWTLSERWLIDANVAQRYRPPSLFELNLPAVTVPAQIYDSRREEAVSALILSGGNRDLKATRGESTNIRAKYTAHGFSTKLNYFSISLWDRIAVLPVPLVLAAEAQMPWRVARAPATAQDLAADRPGRLMFVNTTRDNVGRLFTQGLDFSIAKRFETAFGAWMPQLDVTWIDTFKYSDVPAADAPMTDRVGVASMQGTITPWRAVASLGWEHGAWAATTYLRLIPGYRDVGGAPIDSQQLLDVHVSYEPSRHLMLSLGVMDLANTSPHFANVGAATGYDSSQWDPVGRRLMLTARVSL
jgi:iron complex outermembrane recepter protein